MIDRYTQQVFYHFVLKDLTILTKWEPDFFDDKILKLCFTIAKDYTLRYKTAPTCEAMKNELAGRGEVQLVKDGVIDSIYSTADTMGGYTEDWIRDHSMAFATWKKLENSLKTTISYVKSHQEEVGIDNVKEITEKAKSVFNTNSLISFDDVDDGSDFWNVESHQTKKMVRSTSGYDFIDTCLDGGYFPGALVCLVGAPKVGKSLFLNNLCAESVRRGQHCVYISLELPEEMINQRIGANMFGIPASSYREFAKDSVAMKKKIEAFKKNSFEKPGELRVKFFPTSTASVIDIETYLLKLEQEMSINTPFKFQNVFIDYINIMRNYRNPNSENTYMKIKQLAEDLKAMGAKNGWAIITATQSNRQQFDSDDMGSKDVSESVGLGATVDGMFGIIATPEMKAMGQYYFKCIYDRVAPFDNKRKTYLLNKEYLRITEDPSTGIVDCYEAGAQGAITTGKAIANSIDKATGKNQPQQSQESFQNSIDTRNDSHMQDMVNGTGGGIAPNAAFDTGMLDELSSPKLFDRTDTTKSTGTIVEETIVKEKPTVEPVVNTPVMPTITLQGINDTSAKFKEKQAEEVAQQQPTTTPPKVSFPFMNVGAEIQQPQPTPTIQTTPQTTVSSTPVTPQIPVQEPKSEPQSPTILGNITVQMPPISTPPQNVSMGGFVGMEHLTINRTPSFSRGRDEEAEKSVLGTVLPPGMVITPPS